MKLLPAILILMFLSTPVLAQDLKGELKDIKPEPRNINGLASVRKLETGIEVYDYEMMDGTKLTFDKPLAYLDTNGKTWKPRDLRPWESRSKKNKVMFNVWNYGLRPVAEMITPVVIGLLRK